MEHRHAFGKLFKGWRTCRYFGPNLGKLKVVLESLQRETTLEEVRTKFGVSTSMIHRWRQEFQAKGASIFVDKRNPRQKAQAQGYAPGESPDDLKKLIGELTVQNEILKKAQGLLAR